MEAWCRAELPQWAADDVAALRLGGEELALLPLSGMVRQLAAAADAAASGRALLARRDSVLEEERQGAEVCAMAKGDSHGGSMGPAAGGGSGAECAICLEVYDKQERAWAAGFEWLLRPDGHRYRVHDI